IGCVAFWLLTGTPVFSGDTPMSTMMMQVSVAPEAPSRRSGRVFPAGLDAVVLSCLAKEPAGRPQSVDELTARMDVVPLPSEWTHDRALEWWAGVPVGRLQA